MLASRSEKKWGRSPFGADPVVPRTVAVPSVAADSYRSAPWVSNPRGQSSASRGGDAMRPRRQEEV
jgi:hypothetical protein